MRILTFNVLAQCYITSAYYPYSRSLKWKKRKDLLECDMYEKFWKEMLGALGYTGMYKQKSNLKKDGVAIFWLPTKYDFVDMKAIELNDVVINDDEDLQERVLRDNVALFIRFKDITENVSVVVATTHLFWDPEQADVKLMQTRFLLQELQGYVEKEEAVVLAGDFNSLPNSEVYNTLTAPYEKFTLKSVYQGNEPEFTNFTEDFSGTLDYILYSGFQLDFNLPLITKEQAIVETALPNSVHASDHIPIVSVLNQSTHENEVSTIISGHGNRIEK